MSPAPSTPAAVARIGAAAVLAAFTLSGCAHGRAGAGPVAPPPSAPGIAARADRTTVLTAVPWVNVPPPVVAWVKAHSRRPAEGTATAAGETWAVLTSGRQPTAIRLFPLILQRDAAGAATVEVALAPGPARAAGAQTALVVALPAGLGGLTFSLHLRGGSRGTPLGPLPAGTCPPGASTSSAWEVCAAQIGLSGASWADAGQGRARATLGGQSLLLGPDGQHGGPAVTWSGPA